MITHFVGPKFIGRPEAAKALTVLGVDMTAALDCAASVIICV